MPADLSELDAILRDVDPTPRPRKQPRRGPSPLRRWLLRAGVVLGGFVLAGALPFLVLIRTGTAMYHAGVPTWLALGGGVLATFLLLLLYLAALGWRMRGRFGVPRLVRWGLAVVVAAYAGYGLLYLSGAHAKDDDVRAEYTALHPLMRLAVGTLVLVDGDVLLTDAARRPADYAAMGLPPAEASLHYRQRDRYVHALDLRTIGRSRLRNWMTATYFRLLGFRTLRHVGTADHLHVSLPVR